MVIKKTKKIKKIKKSRVPKTHNGGMWTESQYFSKIRSTLRNGFRYYKPMQDALNLASRPSQSPNKRIKKEYFCKKCLKWFKRLDVEIHHIEECGSLQSYDDIVPFIKRLTVEDVNGYAILCKPCHKTVTDNYKQSKKCQQY
jgi:hypothetical protein